jgi:hypothetical protein
MRFGSSGSIAVPADSRETAAIDRHVRARGEGMYALVLQSADPPAAVAGLLARGVAAAPSGEAADVVALGTRFIIEPVS